MQAKSPVSGAARRPRPKRSTYPQRASPGFIGRDRSRRGRVRRAAPHPRMPPSSPDDEPLTVRLSPTTRHADERSRDQPSSRQKQERVAGRVEEHPDIMLGLVSSDRGSECDCPATAESRPPTWKSKCIIGRCCPSTTTRFAGRVSIAALGRPQRVYGSGC
jgi:hypothetical protein